MNATIDISNVIIKTERLILRPWKESDLHDLYEYASVDGVEEKCGFKHLKLIKYQTQYGVTKDCWISILENNAPYKV